MERKDSYENKKDLNSLCSIVRELIGSQEYQKSEVLICDAMGKYPHAPQPHNLFGILLEKTGEHVAAMKHFRAAWSLEPTYLPARENLECYGTFFSNGRCVYDESDCISNESTKNHSNYKIENDSHGIAHIIRRE